MKQFDRAVLPLHAIACVTSIGVRITPPDRMAVHNSDLFRLQATSAETNVLNVASSLGMGCLAMTKFVKGSPVAEFIKQQLRARNIRFEGVEVEQGGPWGFRHQFNIADSGFGLRAPRVWNDRAGEVGRTLCIDDFDVERIFGHEGVGILHISGLIAAMSPETTQCCLALAEAAKRYGTLVSFDLNYRATFWEGREAELSAAFHALASCADILVGNEEDFQLCLGFKGPEAGGKELKGKIDSFKAMITQVKERYPNARMFATTLRQVISANEHLWGAILLDGDTWYVEEPRPIQVMDRIGGGDGFTGGVLYGVLNGWNGEKCLQFGWASGVLAASSLNDYAEPADEKQVWDVYAGSIEKATPTAENFSFTAPTDLIYNGKAKTAAIVPNTGITGMGDVSVKYGRDGREVQNPTNAGTYTVKIAVIEGTNYATASELTAERWKFTIARNTTEPTVTLSGDTTYTGGQIKPTVTVIVRETTLVVGQDYTVTYGENKNAGENAGSVTVKAMGNYEFTDKTENFSIGKKTLTAADLEFTTGSTFTKVYDGKDTCETVTV